MIAVFDSGLGGLCVLGALRRALPGEDLLYYADTAHLPYGEKPADALCRLACADLAFVSSFAPRAVVAACGTVSAVALPALEAQAAVPLFGVIRPTAEAAARIGAGKRIGVLATEASVRAHAYEDEILRLCPSAQVLSLACPDFVPFLESGGDVRSPEAVSLCAGALRPLAGRVDLLLLGCTHFVLLSEAIGAALPGLPLLDCGACTADFVAHALVSCPSDRAGRTVYRASGSRSDFLFRAQRLGLLPFPVPALSF